jgi:hypothetical protein
MLMFKKTFLSLSCAAALAAGVAPVFASSTFFLVVPLNNGQLGDNSTANRNAPVDVPGD